MHISIMSTKCEQGLKKIHSKLLEKLITQTPCPILVKAAQNDIDLKGHNSVKNNFISIKTLNEHLQYVNNTYTHKASKRSINNWGRCNVKLNVRTDERTGANLNAPSGYRYGCTKNKTNKQTKKN